MQYVSACDKCCADLFWVYPKWVENHDGGFIHLDEDGLMWRMYKFIPDKTGDEENVSAYEAGLGLGRLHYILKQCDDIKEIRTIAHLHDLLWHYSAYENAKVSMVRDKDADALIAEYAKAMLSVSVPLGNIIHGDAKAANMLIRDGHVVGFIDLDTIKTGSRFDDLADCIRSCCITDGKYDKSKADELLDGYMEGADTGFSASAGVLVHKNVARASFMLAIRYYTDYLTGGDYFSGSTSEHKLERAKQLLETVQSMQNIV